MNAAEGRKPDGTYDELQIDYSSVLVRISYQHWLIHQGRLNYAIQRVRGSAEIRSQLIRTGAKILHVSLFFTSGIATPVELYEGAIVTAIGDPLARRNYNRNYPDNNTASLFYTDPVYSGGEAIRPNQAGYGANQGFAISGNSGTEFEYNLKPNTDYVFEQSPSGSTDTVLIFDFYEV